MGMFSYIKEHTRKITKKNGTSKKVRVKSILYQGFSVMMTFLFSMLLTQNIEVSVSISLLDIIFKTMLYFIFEVQWNKLMKRM